MAQQYGQTGLTGEVGQPMEFAQVAPGGVQTETQSICVEVPTNVEVGGIQEQTIRIPQPGALRKDNVSTALEEEARRLRQEGIENEVAATAGTFKDAERARAHAAFVQAEAAAAAKASLASVEALEKQRLATLQAHTLLAESQNTKDQLFEESRLAAEANIQNAAQLKAMREAEADRKAEELLAAGSAATGVRYEVREVPIGGNSGAGFNKSFQENYSTTYDGTGNVGTAYGANTGNTGTGFGSNTGTGYGANTQNTGTGIGTGFGNSTDDGYGANTGNVGTGTGTGYGSNTGTGYGSNTGSGLTGGAQTHDGYGVDGTNTGNNVSGSQGQSGGLLSKVKNMLPGHHNA